MSYKKISSALPVLFIFACLFQSCSDDDIINQSGNIVTGKVVDLSGLPIANMKLRIDEQITYSFPDGGFKFKNVTFPYDLALIDSQHKRYFLYKGLSTSEVKIPNYYYSPASWHVGVLNVTIPNEILVDDVKGKIIFAVDGGNNYVQDLGINNLFNVELPDLTGNYTGKLIVLTYKTDDDGNILEYVNYGQSETININSYSYISYHFFPNQLSLNPGEETISGTFTHPSGFNASEGYFYLAFTDKRINYFSEGLKFANIGDVFNFYVPSNLPSEFSILIGKRTTDGHSSASEIYKVAKHSGINLETKIPPALIAPENYATGVNGSTVFSYNTGNGDGVYTLWFVNPSDNLAFYISTESTSISFSDILNFNEGNVSNADFLWFVNKLGHCIGINEFMTTYRDKQSFFGSDSGDRHFTTAK